MYNPDDPLVLDYYRSHIHRWYERTYDNRHFSPYLEACWNLYEDIFGPYDYKVSWWRIYGRYNAIAPVTNMFGVTTFENKCADFLIEQYHKIIPEYYIRWRELKQQFKEGIHKIYSEVMAARAGPQRRSMFGHSYESIVPEE
jgi:hypothetical protein